MTRRPLVWTALWLELLAAAMGVLKLPDHCGGGLDCWPENFWFVPAPLVLIAGMTALRSTSPRGVAVLSAAVAFYCGVYGLFLGGWLLLISGVVLLIAAARRPARSGR